MGYIFFDISSKFCPKEDIVAPCTCENYGIESNSGLLLFDCNERNLTDENVSETLARVPKKI